MKFQLALSLLLSCSSWRDAMAGWSSDSGRGEPVLGQGARTANMDTANQDPKEIITVVVAYKDETGHQHARGSAVDPEGIHELSRLGASIIKTTRAELEKLNADPHVVGAIENKIDEYHILPFVRGEESTRRLQSGEETPYGIKMVEADQLDQGDHPVKVCVVDTGYDNTHEDLPELESNDGFSPYGDQQLWNEDGHGHGSHCAGTIGAIGNNNLGVTSVNPDYNGKFSFFIGKGLTNSGSGSSIGVLEAVNKCAENGAEIISMSLGGGSFSLTAETTYQNLYDQGVLIFAAAGNGGSSAKSYPASYNGVVSVAAVDSSENKAGFSQYNDQVEIAAPGVAVQSTVPLTTEPSGYASWSGTSMACPHVAGVAALVWSHFPDCNNTQILNALLLTAEDKGNAGCDNEYGYGIVKAKQAYDYLLANGCEAASSGEGGCDRVHQDKTCSTDDDCDDNNCNTIDSCVDDVCENTEGDTCTAPATCQGNNVCCADDSFLKLKIKIDNYGGETNWNLKTMQGAEISIGEGYPANSEEDVAVACLTQEGDYIFEINDDYGDGICCSYGPGYYDLTLGSALVHHGDGQYGSGESVPFSYPLASPPSTVPPTVAPILPPTPLPTFPPTVAPILPPTLLPTVPPTVAPITPPTPSPTTTKNDKVCAVLELQTDNHANEISWKLEGTLSGKLISSGSGSEYGNHQFNNIDLGCHDSGTFKAYNFTIQDTKGDGICCDYGFGYYKIKLDGIVAKEGGMYDFSEFFQFPVDDTKKLFEFEIKTDYWGSETSWKLTSSTDDKLGEGTGFGNEQVIDNKYELTADQCYEFTIDDTHGDGILYGHYKLFWDGDVVYDSNPDNDMPNIKELFNSRTHAIGDGCTGKTFVTNEGVVIRKAPSTGTS